MEFFAFCHTFHEIVCEILQNAKNDKCISRVKSVHIIEITNLVLLYFQQVFLLFQKEFEICGNF